MNFRIEGVMTRTARIERPERSRVKVKLVPTRVFTEQPPAERLQIMEEVARRGIKLFRVRSSDGEISIADNYLDQFFTVDDQHALEWEYSDGACRTLSASYDTMLIEDRD